jgi:hypothetical protein
MRTLRDITLDPDNPDNEGRTELETQLVDSLWRLCTGIEPMQYQMDVLRHIPHMRGSSERIRRMSPDGNYVLILCVCKVALRFVRCHHPGCEEECMPGEATLLSDARCVFHRASNDAWQPHSRFFRCDYFNGDPPDGRCSGVAVRTDAEGRHWCMQEDHGA